MYKNNKDNNTHTHTLSGLYMMHPAETEGTSAASRSPRQLRSVTGAEELRCDAALCFETGNGPPIKQAPHSYSLYTTPGLSGLVFKPVGDSSQPHAAAVSPALRGRVVCTTARPNFLLRNTNAVRQTHRGREDITVRMTINGQIYYYCCL